MGQYHYLVNLTRREFVHPHQLGDGLKLWEMAGHSLGGIATAAIYLLAAPEPRGGGDFGGGIYMGRWHGNRIAMVGDYAEPGDGLDLTDADISDLQGEAPQDWANITPELREALADEFGLTYSGDGWMNRGPRGKKPDAKGMQADMIVTPSGVVSGRETRAHSDTAASEGGTE